MGLDEGSYTIRPAQPDDASAVVALTKEQITYHNKFLSESEQETPQFTKKRFLKDGFGENAAFHMLVAEVNGKVMGYLMYFPYYSLWDAHRVLHVHDIYVSPICRGKGLGKKLLAYAAQIARDGGFKSLMWNVHRKNQSALKLYESIGAETYTGDFEVNWYNFDDFAEQVAVA